MLLQAFGAVLPAAFAVALSPFPVIAIVLILAGGERGNGVLFAVGWLAGLTLVSLLTVLVFGGADDADSTSSAIADALRVLAGATLIVLGARKWRQRPRGEDTAEPPKWAATLDQLTPVRSLRLGLLLSGANPKNFVLTAAAVTSVIETDVHGARLAAPVAVFVLIGSSTVVGAVLVHLVGGQRAVRLLDSVRDFMISNSVVITVIVLLLLGASILGDGLAGFGR